jgi:hypothetical protein
MDKPVDRSLLLQGRQFKTKQVKWDPIGVITLRQLSGETHRDLNAYTKDKPEMQEGLGWYALIITESIIDEHGNKLLQREDVQTLLERYSSSDIAGLGVECIEFNGAFKASVEEIEKNSEETPSSDSSSS